MQPFLGKKAFSTFTDIFNRYFYITVCNSFATYNVRSHYYVPVTFVFNNRYFCCDLFKNEDKTYSLVRFYIYFSRTKLESNM